MKLKITLKDPDGVYDSIEESIRESVEAIEGLSEQDREALMTSRQNELNLERWVQYGEYVTIEIDTESNEARVVPVGER